MDGWKEAMDGWVVGGWVDGWIDDFEGSGDGGSKIRFKGG
jgi:hypothetical protein